MSLLKVPLTETDIEILRKKKKSNTNIRLWVLTISIFILLISYFCSGFDQTSESFKFLKIIVIVIIGALFLGTLIDTNFDNDFKEKQKFVGSVKIKKKEYWHDIEDNRDFYIITFDDWRIGEKSVMKDFWNKSKEGDEFYIEQAMNSGFIFRFEKENMNYINELGTQNRNTIV